MVRKLRTSNRVMVLKSRLRLWKETEATFKTAMVRTFSRVTCR